MTHKITTFDNGMRVVTHAMPHVETVSLGVWVKAGARNEAPHQNGLSHLLEHMAFKGTKNRSALQIAEDIECAGGDINAATGMESTSYFARVLKGDVALALDVLADILINPVFDATELQRELQVVAQEIAASKDSPDDLVFDLAQEAAFPGQPLGRSILGTMETLGNFSPDAIDGYRDANYGAGAMVLSAAGAVDHEQFVEIADKAFGAIRSGSGTRWAPGRYRGGEAIMERPLEQTHLVLSFRAPGYTNDDFYCLQVLSSVLGGGMSSRLFQELRERRGLCYSVGTFTSAFEETGTFGVYAATGPTLASELMTVLTDELEKFAATVSDAEVARSRAQLKAGILMCLESSAMRADQMARQLHAFDRILSEVEIAERIDAIDKPTVAAMARDLLNGAEPSFAAVGPNRNLASLWSFAAKSA